jgi:hypothetical protein
MSKQPLTNTITQIVVLGPSQEAIEFELQQYNFPSDPLDITPTLVSHAIMTYEGLMAFLLDEPPASLPLVCVGHVSSAMRNVAESYFGPSVTMAVALSMVNNEYAIRRDQIINGTVPQTPKRRDY